LYASAEAITAFCEPDAVVAIARVNSGHMTTLLMIKNILPILAANLITPLSAISILSLQAVETGAIIIE